MLADLLRFSGHHVRVANGGREALGELEKEPADVVVLDLGLPDMPGFDVAIAVRTRFGNRTRIVALTGKTGRDARERARLAGIDAYILKPCNLDNLLATLVP